MHVGGGSVVVSVTTQWCLRRVQRALCCRACGVHAARNRRAHGMSACVGGSPWSSGSPRGVKVGVNAAAAKITEHYSPARAGEGDRQTDRLSLRGGRTRSRNNSNRHEFKRPGRIEFFNTENSTRKGGTVQLRTSERIIFERAGVGARPRSGCWAHQLLRSAVLALYIGKRNTLPESRRHVCRPSHVKKTH